MKEKISKTEAEKEIKEFFSNINDRTPKEIRKMKKLAMKHSIKLGNLRKKFCKKCYSPYKNSKTRIKNKTKSTICKNCGYIYRWKIK